VTAFIDAAVAYPTAIYTTLLGALIVYWLLALVGLVDVDLDGGEMELQADAELEGVGGLSGIAMALGLRGVPFSIVISLTLLIAWTLTCLAAMWLLPLVPTQVLRIAVGTAALIGGLGLGLLGTAAALRPFQSLFVTQPALRSASLVGERCRVTTGHVDEAFGYAEVSQRGASINVRVWARTPNALAAGSMARIVEYDENQGRFRIEAEA
jgi:hypothetical protein